MSNVVECHSCEQSKQKNGTIFIAKCCIKKCSKSFCIDCIQKHFNPEFDSLRYRKDTWICYCCQEICHCERCKKSELLSIQRKNSKKKPPKTPPTIKNTCEESIDNSQSNVSQSINSKPIEFPSGNLTKQLENEQPNILKCEKMIKEEIEEPLPKFNIMEEDEFILLPKFMKQIVQRKNLFYNFILQQERRKQNLCKNTMIKNQRKQIDILNTQK